jgi:hypothetical protein
MSGKRVLVERPIRMTVEDRKDGRRKVIRVWELPLPGRSDATYTFTSTHIEQL